MRANSAMQLWNILCISTMWLWCFFLSARSFCIMWFFSVFKQVSNFSLSLIFAIFRGPNILSSEVFLRATKHCAHYFNCHTKMEKLKRTTKLCIHTNISVNTCDFIIQSNRTMWGMFFFSFWSTMLNWTAMESIERFRNIVNQSL